MSKFDSAQLTPKNAGLLISEFWKAITLIENYQEAKDFLRDLLNPTESIMLARRLQIAKMLEEGYTYEMIIIVLRIGHPTVAKVARWYKHGMGGYRKIVKRLIELDNQRLSKRNKEFNPYSFESIKSKYAMYYWPQNLMGKLESSISDYLKISRKLRSIPK